ncbi:MAG: hypothetical protein Q8N54_14255 [Sulfurimicrobium sp.]|nr:hypothetical protein [Sulfurimicrobium sp.]MDZ7654501.1 hypothetical protein [Sulfurimicrobium sp.]
MVKELLESFQPAGGSADADDGESACGAVALMMGVPRYFFWGHEALSISSQYGAKVNTTIVAAEFSGGKIPCLKIAHGFVIQNAMPSDLLQALVDSYHAGQGAHPLRKTVEGLRHAAASWAKA